ncbi:MAG: hypothetical protein AVDCRST_MAG27-826, partial [uncultured Craurococcus sp.]
DRPAPAAAPPPRPCRRGPGTARQLRRADPERGPRPHPAECDAGGPRRPARRRDRPRHHRLCPAAQQRGAGAGHPPPAGRRPPHGPADRPQWQPHLPGARPHRPGPPLGGAPCGRRPRRHRRGRPPLCHRRRRARDCRRCHGGHRRRPL